MIEGSPRPEDLTGMDPAAAREYIFHHRVSLKLTEKQYQATAESLAQWTSRISLARSKGAEDLAQEAEKEAANLKTQQDRLEAEIRELKTQIGIMERQLPGLISGEQRVNPDLLEQELLIAAGYMPGDEKKAEADRRFQDMEKNASADAALAALKAKMGLPHDPPVS